MSKNTNTNKRHLVMTHNQWSLGHSYDECMRMLKLKPNTRKPHVHWAFNHDHWEFFPDVGEWRLRWPHDAPTPDAPVVTKYNITD